MNKAEERIQQEIFTYHWNTYPEERKLLFMVNNNPKNKIDGARLKSLGLVAGVSDLIYVNPRDCKVYFVELKTPKGRQDPEQIIFENKVTALGFKYLLIRSLDEMINFFWNE